MVGEAWSVPGFAGIPNELFIRDNALMVSGDAKKVLQDTIGGTERPVSRIRLTAMTKREALASPFFVTRLVVLISDVASATRRKPVDPQDPGVNAAIRLERMRPWGSSAIPGAHGCLSNILKCTQATLVNAHPCAEGFWLGIPACSEKTVCARDGALEPYRDVFTARL